MTLGPVFVTVLPARTPKLSAVPRICAFASLGGLKLTNPTARANPAMTSFATQSGRVIPQNIGLKTHPPKIDPVHCARTFR
jgi:hypothetical protein